MHKTFWICAVLIPTLLTSCSSGDDLYCESLQREIREDLIALQNLPSEFEKEFWDDDEAAAKVIGIKRHLERLQAKADSISCYR
jgi:hypothetical protein